MNISVRLAEPDDASVVSELVHGLLTELAATQGPTLDAVATATASILGKEAGVWMLLAFDETEAPVGVLTLNECTAIYAGGKFGEISEFYVRPESRSGGVGPCLLAEATQIGHKRGWGRIEVGAPSMPRWERTVNFYKGNGFTEVGPRLRLMLS